MTGLHRFLRGIHKRYFRPDRLAELRREGLVVGESFHMLGEVLIDSSHCWHITIGDYVTLAPRVMILAHDASTKMHLGYSRIGKVSIGNHVFIGASSIILPGVTVGNDVVIGAGSVVCHDIPDGVVAAGNPAKTLRTIDDFLSRRRSEMKSCPCFGKEYTLGGNVTDEMKNEMNKAMNNRFGYVV